MILQNTFLCYCMFMKIDRRKVWFVREGCWEADRRMYQAYDNNHSELYGSWIFNSSHNCVSRPVSHISRVKPLVGR